MSRLTSQVRYFGESATRNPKKETTCRWSGIFRPAAFLLCLTILASATARAADKTWNGTVNNNWSNPGNWDLGLPGASDNALITAAGATVTLDTSVTIAGLTLGGAAGTQTLNIASNTLTLNGAGTVGANGVLNLSGSGTLTGTGALTVSGAMNWAGGTMAGTGSTTIAFGAQLNISGAGNKDLSGRTLTNAGTATWTGGGYLRSGSSAVFNNQAGGVFDAQSDTVLAYDGGGGGKGTFNNAGTFRKSAGAGTTTISGPVFNSTGTVDVQTGTLHLSSGGTGTGAFTVAANAALNFSGYTLGDGATIGGAGTAANIGGLTLSGTTTGATLSAGGTLDSSGAVGGSGKLTMNGTMNWTGGNLDGAGTLAIAVGRALNISGAAIKGIRSGWILNNAGTTTWTGSGLLRSGSGAVFNNQAGAVFDAQSDSSFVYDGGGGGAHTFNNAGTFKKSGGAGTTTISGPTFNNTGTVQVLTGTLDLAVGGTSTGAFTADANTTLRFSSGTQNLGDGVTLSGAGVLEVAGATVNMTGTGTGATVNAGTALTLSSGTIGSTGKLTVNGTMNWSGGQMAGAGSTTIAFGAQLNLSGTANKDFRGGWTINNAGTTTWTGSGLLRSGSGAVFNNQSGGVFDAQSDSSFVYDGGGGGAGTFNNAGTLKKSTGVGTTAITGPAFNNTGTVDVQTGTLRLETNGTHSGAFNTAAGSKMVIAGGAHTWNDGVTFSGAGVSETTVGATVAGTNAGASVASGATLTQTAGNLSGSGKLTLNGTMSVTGGSMSGSGSVVVASGGLLDFAQNYNVNDRTIDNRGTVDIDATKTATLTGATFIQNGGVTTGTGTLSGNSAAHLYGFGNIAPVVTNQGQTHPGLSPGTLNLGQTLTQSGTVYIELGGRTAGTEYDQLNVTGAATLSGTLTVSLINSFNPQLGDTFEIMTYGSRSGDFGTVNLPVLTGGKSFQRSVNAANMVLTVVGGADLSLTKTVDNATPARGANVTFTVTVTNGGPVAATGVQVQDMLPAGLTYVSDDGPETYTSGTGIWSVGNLANGASATLHITARADTSGSLTNTAHVHASDQSDPDSTPGNNDGNEDDQKSVIVNVQPSADLSLTKTVDDNTPDFNGNVTFTVTVTNNGPDDATGVTMKDLLSSGLTYVSDDSSGGYNSGTGIWDIGGLANGGSAPLQIVAKVTGTGSITNTAQVQTSDQADADSTPGNSQATEDDQASQTLTVGSVADLSLTKTVDDDTPNYGTDVTFTVTVTNGGPNDATDVTVKDLLPAPAGLRFVSATPSTGAYASGTGIWTIGNLANGATATLQLVATVSQTGPLTNTAQVQAATEFDPDSTPGNNDGNEDDQKSVTVYVQDAADLRLTKTASSTTPNYKSNVTFTVTVTNGSPDNATGVTVKDVLPAGLTYVSDTPSTGTYTSGTGLWDVGNLANGASATLEIVARVDQTGALVNTSQVQAATEFDPDSTPGNSDPNEDDQASVTLTVPPAADLSLTKTASTTTPNYNDNVTFTVTVTNGGPNDATGVTVKDLLPAGLTFVSATPSVGTYVSGTGIWTVGALPFEEGPTSATLEIVATVAATGSLINTAQVQASDQSDPDSTPGNSAATEDDQASVTLNVPSADLSLTKTTSSATPSLGGSVTFTITVTNSGPDEATGVTVKDLVPAGLTFVSATPSQGSYTAATGIWSVGALAFEEGPTSATLEIVATVAATGSIVNTAQVQTADQADADSTPGNSQATEDDQASATLTVPSADLSLTKAVSSSTPSLGSSVTFTITVTNFGPNDATGVTVKDLLPAGLTFVSATPSQGTYTQGTGLWDVGALPFGEGPTSATLEIVATVTATGSIINTAQVEASDKADPDSTPGNSQATEDDQASVSISATTIADLSLTKTASNPAPLTGTQVTFTITVTNSGPNDATGVTVKDLLPSGLTFVSATPSQGTYTQGTGIWDVGALAFVEGHSSATLEIIATVAATGSIVNTAQVETSDQTDPDSTPGNSVAGEDDQATATLSVPTPAYTRNYPTGLSLISVPYDVDAVNPATLFDLPPAEFDMAIYDGVMNAGRNRFARAADPEGGYNYFDGDSPRFNLGHGAWIRLDAPETLTIYEGYDAPDPSQRFIAPMGDRWFIIGNPWLGEMEWKLENIWVMENGHKVSTLADEVRKPIDASLVEPYCYTYDSAAGAYRFVFDPRYANLLVPDAKRVIHPKMGIGEGAFMYFHRDGLSLSYPPVQPGASVATAGRASRSASGANGWTTEIMAAVGSVMSRENLLGQSSHLRSAGAFQVRKPPAILTAGDWVDLSFVGKSPDTLLSIDVHPVRAADQWRFVVRTSLPNQAITLTWPRLGTAPRTQQFVLIDEATGKKQFMRTSSACVFRTDAQASPRYFRIETVLAGSFAALRISNVTVLDGSRPRSANIDATFTLSKAAEVEVRMLTPTGRAVWSTRGSMNAGLNRVALPRQDRLGRFLPSGRYLIEIIATTEEQQQVRAVRVVSIR